MTSPTDCDPPTDPSDTVVSSNPEPSETAPDHAPPDEADVAAHQEQIEREQAGSEDVDSARSTINSQVADALALTDSAAVAGAVIVAAAEAHQVAAYCSALAMLNAVSAQQNAQLTANAAVVASVRGITAALRERRPQ